MTPPCQRHHHLGPHTLCKPTHSGASRNAGHAGQTPASARHRDWPQVRHRDWQQVKAPKALVQVNAHRFRYPPSGKRAGRTATINELQHASGDRVPSLSPLNLRDPRLRFPSNDGQTPDGTRSTCKARRVDLTPPIIPSLFYIYNIIEPGFSYVWFIPITELNRLHHALHGNGIMSKLHTAGMPILPTGSRGTPEEFINWQIDFQGWLATSGITTYVVGPLPEEASEGDTQEGMRYLCAAIADTNLRSAVAGHGPAPNAFEWLEAQFLQGVAKQPALLQILDGMALQPNENMVSFKMRFVKILNEIQPDLDSAIACMKFASAIKRNTGTSFDDCLVSASSSDDQSDFERYSNLLVRICTQKQGRDPPEHLVDKHNQEIKALTAKIDALSSSFQERRDHPKQERDRRGKGGRGDKEPRMCFNCGKRHQGRCLEPTKNLGSGGVF